jgi:hypothetical protein
VLRAALQCRLFRLLGQAPASDVYRRAHGSWPAKRLQAGLLRAFPSGGQDVQGLERAKGIEPSYAAWEAAVLPLNYARLIYQVNQHLNVGFGFAFRIEFGAILVAGRADRATLPDPAVGATGFPIPPA